MIYICATIAVFILLLAFLCRNYKSEIFRPLKTSEHVLKFLYPLSARLSDLIKGGTWRRSGKNARFMKQLHVRENIEEDMYIFTAKKLSASVGIILIICIMGIFTGLQKMKDTSIHSLMRPDYGSGQINYQLDASYDGDIQTIDVPVDARKRTKEEILKLFEDNYDAVITRMLGENESIQNVCHDIDLISSYGEIKLSWEIEDTSLLNYNGELSDSVPEDEFVPLNILVTFSIDDTSQVFSVPLVLTARSKSSGEQLIEKVAQNIEDNNSVYSSEVVLPKELEGKAVTFKKKDAVNAGTLLVIGVLAAVMVFILFDRRLEDKAKKRSEQMAEDFTEIVFKLSLLYEAGLSIFRAWERIVDEYEKSASDRIKAQTKRQSKALPEERYAYKEMRLTLEQIKNGASEAESYGQFGKRCGLHQYIKLGNILEQNLTKGAKGMKTLLRQEAQDSFEERKRLARKKGEEASTKMLVPMVMMLIVVMVIVAVPALMSISF